MLKIAIVAPGKLKEHFWKEACAEYLKRLQAYAQVKVFELADSNPEKEEALIFHTLDGLPSGTHVVLMDINGKELSSVQLAERLEKLTVQGTSEIAFVLGGSDGVTRNVRERADERISFGPITMPHNLARVVLLEQLYRACKINRHEPYHK